MYDPSFSGAVLQRSYETIVRDINKPSIIYWSIGNEDPLTSLHMVSVKNWSRHLIPPVRYCCLGVLKEWLPKRSGYSCSSLLEPAGI